MFVAFLVFFLMLTVLGGKENSFRTDMVVVLSTSIVAQSHKYLCCIPLEPSSAIDGSYTPPVFTSQTGTGSDVEVGVVQEALICGRPAVTHSKSTHDARGAYSIVKDGGDVGDA